MIPKELTKDLSASMSMAKAPDRPADPGFFPFESRRSTPIFRSPAMIARHETLMIEYMWRLFNNLPRHNTRLKNAYGATLRMLARRDSILPVREAYTTTVDYYEAALPLFVARRVFKRDFLLHDSFLSLSRACKTILPEELF